MIASLSIVLGLLMAPISSAGAGGAQGYWDWQLTNPYNLDLDVKVLALDGEEHTAGTIASLKARGIKTICYVSVGTWEDFRDDADAFPDDVLGATLADWPGERYIDIRRTDIVMPIMRSRIDNCKARGFDAVEPDNMDGFENDNGFGLTEIDGLVYIARIAEYVQSIGLEIAQKNAPTLVPHLVQSFDFMLVEDCFRYDFCWDIKPYVAAGKDVLAVEYTDSNLNWEQICTEARDLGFHLLLKDREVAAGGRVCLWDE